MRCEEALQYWQQELLGQPVDRDKLEEAYAHIGACQELCAHTLSAAPDFDLPSLAERRSGQTDLYEALGLAAEEEGDGHAREWARLRRRASTGKVTQEALDYERAMAVAAWQAAANYYHDGLGISETAFLTEGLKRLKHKRLEPAAPTAKRAKAATRARLAHGSGRKIGTPLPKAAAPGESAPKPPPEAQPFLSLVSHVSTRSITVGQHPFGWQIQSARSGSPLVVRESPALYYPRPQSSQEPPGTAAAAPSEVDGELAPFNLALWATASAENWALDLLVRAQSPRRPWSSILLTLEDQHQQFYKPTLMEFSRRDPQRTGWLARLKDIAPGAYQLRLSANNASGRASEEATLALHLASEM